MAYNYDEFNGQSLVFKYNVDNNGNPITVKIENENKQVSTHGTIQLEHVPDEFNRVLMLDDKNKEMVEVFNKDEITPITYYIDYNNGVAYLDKTQFGKTKIYNYYSRGLQLIGCSRIFDEHDVRGQNVLLTLQEIIDAGKECIRILLNIGDAWQIIQRLESDIAEGRQLILDIEGAIVKARADVDGMLVELEDKKTDCIRQIDEAVQNGMDNIVNVAGNIEIQIPSSAWVLNNGSYEKQITHNLNSEKLHVSAINSDTKEAITIGYKVVDKSNVILKSDENINANIVLSASYYNPYLYGNGEIAEEVVAARGNKANLKERLDLVDSSLDSKVNDDIYQFDKNNINTNITNVDKKYENLTNKQKENGINIMLFDGADDTEKFQNALNSEFTILYIPNITLIRPVTVPFNSGKTLIGVGGLKGSMINCNLPSQYIDMAVIRYTVPSGQLVHNDKGITLKNIWLRGNNSTCHGIFLKYTCYPFFENVIIEGFKGCGLWIDKCQDGSFNNLVIQDCGRSSGDYNNLDDMGNNAKTIYAPLELTSSWSGDKCNMLRFNDCQIEENKLSPYVRITGGGIGIWFNNIHAEVRTHGFGKMDFIEITNGGDYQFTGMAVSDTFRNGFICKGDGQFKFSNSRLLNNVIIGEVDNKSYQSYRITDCGIKNVTVGSGIGDNSISNCSFTNLTLNKPSNVHNFYGLKLGTITVNDQGAYPWITIENSIMDNLNANATSKNVIVNNCTINSNCTMNTGEGGRLTNCQLNGTNTLAQDDISMLPKIRWGRRTMAPTQGNWGKGDIVFNYNPATGQPVGWICTATGNPGTWKGFGVIQ